MANDTTALAEAIRATRDAVASMETAMNYRTAGRAADATVALLAALDGVPERIALLEAATTAATDLLEENAWGDGAFAGVWAIDEYGQGVIVNLRDTLAALAGEGQG